MGADDAATSELSNSGMRGNPSAAVRMSVGQIQAVL